MSQPQTLTIRLPMYLANRLATYLDNLRADRLADQAGGLNRFTAEHQAILSAVMQAIQATGQPPAEAMDFSGGLEGNA